MAASLFYNRIKYTAVSSGTADFVTSAAVSGFRTPATASIPNGTLVSYVAFSSDQSEWETGQGAYTSGTTTVARTTVRESSNGGSKTNFSSAPTVALDFQAQDALNLPTLAIGGATIGTNALAVTGTGEFSGALFGPSGGIGSTVKAYSFTSDPTSGLYRNSTIGYVGFMQGNSKLLSWTAATGFSVTAAMTFNWSSTSSSEGAIDTNLSRNAAGIIQFGTTAANAAGSWLATNGTLSGQLQVKSGNAGTYSDINFYGTTDRASLYGGDGGTNNGGIIWYSSWSLAWGSGTTGDAYNTPDAVLSRNAAGVIQFGTTAKNASGAWLAAKGTLATGTITTSQPAIDISQTWNAGGVTFTGALISITATAAAAASKVLDIKIDGASQMSLYKDGSFLGFGGVLNVYNSATGAVTLYTASTLGWASGNLSQSTTPDTNFSRRAAGVIQVGTTAANQAGFLEALGVGAGGNSSTAAIITIAAGTTAKSQLNFASSTAPTSPNNGDMWFDGTDFKVRVGGATKTITII